MKDNLGQIIAIGGGGFGRNPYNNKIDKYIVDQSYKDIPNVCFIPTASAENDAYIVNFYTSFNKLNCNPVHLSLFKRTPNLESLINKQDIIYVGGGNTKSMLAVWKEWKLDKLLDKAFNNGKILCGVSAGSICWFEKGVTDSWASNLNLLDCLSIIDGCSCPQYNSESDRRPTLANFIKNGKIKECYASDDGSAIHFKGNKLHTAVSFYENAKSYVVKTNENQIIEEEIKSIKIY